MTSWAAVTPDTDYEPASGLQRSRVLAPRATPCTHHGPSFQDSALMSLRPLPWSAKRSVALGPGSLLLPPARAMLRPQRAAIPASCASGRPRLLVILWVCLFCPLLPPPLLIPPAPALWGSLLPPRGQRSLGHGQGPGLESLGDGGATLGL